MKKWIDFLRDPEVWRYLFFGVLTTVVSMISYMFARWCKIDYQTANVLSWICAVTFAYITNKFYVFGSKETSLSVILREGIRFYGARIVSLGLEMGSMWIFVDLLSVHDLIAKCIGQVIVVIANYIFSKFIVFKKN